MKDLIRRIPAKTVTVFFTAIYGLALALAIFPPFYLAASGSTASVLGMPWAISYWIVDAALVGLSLAALYWVEGLRGDLEE